MKLAQTIAAVTFHSMQWCRICLFNMDNENREIAYVLDNLKTLKIYIYVDGCPE